MDNNGGTRAIFTGASDRQFYLIGRQNSPKSHELRTFLARNEIPFHWVDLDSDPLVGFLFPGVQPASLRWPVGLFPDGSRLEAPSSLELARRLGLHTRPDLPEYDLAIIGAGPAGLTAAVYAASEGLRTVVVEREATGGQAATSSKIENYPGFPEGITGMELTDRALIQAQRFGAELILANTVAGVRPGRPLVHYLLDGSELVSRSDIIATGVSYRRLTAPGIADLVGRGVYYGSALTVAPSYRDKDTFVAGGGNSAGQLALHIANFARSVTLLVRGASLEQSMSRYLIDRLESVENIHLWFRSQVIRAEGDEYLRALVLRKKDVEVTVPADALFLLIGQRPATDWADGLLAKDEQGFLLTGSDLPKEGEQVWHVSTRAPLSLETNRAGVFAAGDVRHGSINRVAWAVGEGAMAAQLVHQYLGKLMTADAGAILSSLQLPPSRVDIDMSEVASGVA